MSALHSSVHCARLEYCAEDQHLNAFCAISTAFWVRCKSMLTAESAAKAQGFAKVIGHGNFLVSLKCALAVLDHLENLNRAVQSSRKSVASMVTAMKMTVDALNDLRDEDRCQALCEESVMLCRKSDVPFPELPRQRRPPKRLCVAPRQHTLGQLQKNAFAISSFRLWILQSQSSHQLNQLFAVCLTRLSS